MKVKTLFNTLAIGSALIFTGSVNAKEHHKASGDEAFVKKASAGGLTEVELGKLAANNGQAQDVKDFGSKMVTDHSQLNDNLKAVAEKSKLTPSDKPNEMQQAMIDKLSKETGKQFDNDYIRAMVKDHIEDKHLFATEEENTSNPDLKKAVGDGLTVIKQHLDMIEGIADAHGLGNGKHHHTSMSMSNGGAGGSTSTDATMPQAGGNGDAAQSKSGSGPGSTGNTAPDASPAGGAAGAVGGADAASAAGGASAGAGAGAAGAAGTGDASQSKSGAGPGGTGSTPQ